MIAIEKPKLPKGKLYVLKTSLLQAALEQAHIDCHVDLHYWVPQSGGSILEAHYWPPNANCSYTRVYVRAGVVPSSEHRAALESLVTSVLPAFIAWLSGIVALPKNSPALQGEPYFNATYNDGRIEISHEPRMKRRK
jgi:hypothetical protein